MSGQVSLRESRKETELEHNKYQEAWHNLQASPQDAQKLHQLALYCQTHFPTNKRPYKYINPPNTTGRVRARGRARRCLLR